MNKKGQELGEIITTFPVFLLVFLIMAIFIGLSSFAVVLKHPTSFAYADTGESNFFLDEFKVDDGETKSNSLLFDKIIDMENKGQLEINSVNAKAVFDKILITQDVGMCFALLKTRNELIYNCRVELRTDQDAETVLLEGVGKECKGFFDGSFESFHSLYGSELKSLSFMSNGKAVNFLYYYGKCLEEKR